MAQVEPPQPPVGQATQPTVQQQETRLQGRFQQDAPATSATMRVPVLQQEKRPQEVWDPELKLPPRREGMEAAPAEAAPAPIPYVYPSLALLKTPAPPNPAGQEEDAFRSQRLEETLKSFKIPARVRHVTHGPAISRFELEMAAGIKVNKVTELDRNIAMNMEVKSVRIEAPIPGKSLVGVEVPNKTVTPVTLREVLETREMKELSSPLGVALGKDIAGLPIVCDLARMPHLLIAGATGSGKSVCVNAMINSILFRSSPEQVRMILVDPKVVELQCYNGIPHLLIPVVSDPHKAAGALSWAVTEMMERYQKFTDRGVREITGYNAALEEGEQPMPRILIVIDELVLKFFDWVSVEANSFADLEAAGVVQSETALHGLWIAYALVPAIGALLALVFYAFYRLNDKDVQIMAKCNAGELSRTQAEAMLSRKY